jgi:hypothetical protein
LEGENTDEAWDQQGHGVERDNSNRVIEPKPKSENKNKQRQDQARRCSALRIAHPSVHSLFLHMETATL